MKVIKKINNNAAVCLDSQNHEMVAIGTGIGFPSVPYEITDLSLIQKTYYDVEPMQLNLLNQIPESIFQVSEEIVGIFRNSVDISISSSLVFTLADHISFAIERTKKGICITNPLQYDVQHLYEKEFEIGQKSVRLIQKKTGIRLPKSEAVNIALHLVNAENMPQHPVKNLDVENIISDITEIVGRTFRIYVDKNSFSYSRFATHLQYLLKRLKQAEQVSTDNLNLYESVVEEYADTHCCVEKIKEYLKGELDFELNEEESMYLILHVNRLCVREDCHRKGITPGTEK